MREMLKTLPANRRVSLHGFEKSWFFWKKPTGVAIASTLSPLAHYVDPKGDDAPPISLGELADHVRGPRSAGGSRVRVCGNPRCRRSEIRSARYCSRCGHALA